MGAKIKKRRSRKGELAALRRESEILEIEQIRTLLRKPMIERTDFLRVRLPWGLGSTL